MEFPPLSHLAKAALIALAFALLGYVATPEAGWSGAPRADAALLLGLGALLGGWLVGVQRRPALGGDEGMKTLFVGNLAFKASEEELRQLFAPYGEVQSVRIMRDRKTRRPRGYGFVELATAQARKATKALDGKEFHGRKLRVKEGNRKEAEGND